MAKRLHDNAICQSILSALPLASMNRLSSERLENIPLTNIERRCLEDVGLPREEMLGWTFDPAIYGIRPVSQIAVDRNIVGFDNDGRLAVAGGQDVLACIDQERQRSIVSVDLMKVERLRFVNGDVKLQMRQFALYK